MSEEEMECWREVCDECEHHRSQSWCALAIPGKSKVDENYKIRMEGFWEGLNFAESEYKNLINTLDDLSREISWIPIEDEEPPERQDVIVTVIDDSGDHLYTFSTTAWRLDDHWISDNESLCGKVIAWMKLPKPYENDTNKDYENGNL